MWGSAGRSGVLWGAAGAVGRCVGRCGTAGGVGLGSAGRWPRGGGGGVQQIITDLHIGLDRKIKIYRYKY